MTPEILNTIKEFSTIGVLALFIYALIPIFRVLAQWISLRIRGTYSNFTVIKKIDQIQNNDLAHLSQEVSSMRTEFGNSINELRRDLSKLAQKVSWLEGVLLRNDKIR